MDEKAARDFYVQYLPDSKEMNYWMFAMIGIGTSFIIFVVVSIYLVCRDDKERSLRQLRSGTITTPMPGPESHTTTSSPHAPGKT